MNKQTSAKENKYKILPSTPVRVKRLDTDWTGQNIQPHKTVNLNTFTDADLVIDPQAVFNPVSDSQEARIKARWAECGYFGFVKGGWILLINKKLVIRQ